MILQFVHVEKISVIANEEMQNFFMVTAKETFIVPSHHFVFSYENKRKTLIKILIRNTIIARKKFGLC